MPGEKDLKRHAALVDDMAGALGLDLEEQMLRGRLGFAELEDAVFACSGCTRPCDCESWLRGRDRQAVAPEAPEYCRNTALFDALRAD